MRYLRRGAAALAILFGLGLMFYPWVSNYVFEHRVDSTVESYQKEVDESDDAAIEEIFLRAQNYNRALVRAKVTLTDPFEMEDESRSDLVYDDMLSVDPAGIMCFVEIPCIDVHLPVYHGTSTEVLEKGAGHIEGSSLPVGGLGNHAVLSAHTGINSARMFTDLTDLVEGDLFFLQVCGRQLAYRVCRILVVDPGDVGQLMPEADRDLVSLLTCTPYGVNTHRLIVTGERTDYTEELRQEAEGENESGSQWMECYLRALTMGLLLTAAGFLGIWLLRKTGERRRRCRR